MDSPQMETVPQPATRKPRDAANDTRRRLDECRKHGRTPRTRKVSEPSGRRCDRECKCVCVRRNPSRRAHPQEKEEAKKPRKGKIAKGPIFKGTYMYMPKEGARGGGLKYMIRLGGRAIERMENTYEKTRPLKKGSER